ncbi:MAG: PTS sugar transporter subunit IIA [Spirochaetes bacterium]|nr:PTS sugar transporter subunit IIA [Spirochaetota bacterium]
MNIVEFTSPAFVKKLKSKNKFKAIEELAKAFDGCEFIGNLDEVIAALKEREQIMSTGIGYGIAIPHARLASITRMMFAIGISKAGIEYDSMDNAPVHLVILVLAGEKQHKEYLKLLSSIMAVLKNEKTKKRIVAAKNAHEVIKILREINDCAQ